MTKIKIHVPSNLHWTVDCRIFFTYISCARTVRSATVGVFVSIRVDQSTVLVTTPETTGAIIITGAVSSPHWTHIVQTT